MCYIVAHTKCICSAILQHRRVLHRAFEFGSFEAVPCWHVQRLGRRMQAELEAAHASTSTPACSEVGSNDTPAPQLPPAEVEPQGSAAAAAAPNAFAALADGRTPPASPARRLVRHP